MNMHPLVSKGLEHITSYIKRGKFNILMIISVAIKGCEMNMHPLVSKGPSTSHLLNTMHAHLVTPI